MTQLIAAPFVVLWRILATLVGLTGRVVAFTLGAVLLLAGVLLSATVIGGILGVPLALIGLLLLARALF